EAEESAPFNGTGQMKTAFTDKSKGWAKAIKNKTDEDKAALMAERHGERLALLDWIHAGASKEAYEKDMHILSQHLAQQPLTDEFLVKDAAGKPVEPRQVAVKTILERRCVDCHSEGGRFVEAAKFPLDKYELVKPYTETKTTGGMSLAKLAQTTHIHL